MYEWVYDLDILISNENHFMEIAGWYVPDHPTTGNVS
jgi:hypothetical protein